MLNNKICATIICKNEEDVIERMLNSIKNITDYIIIIDSGSTDLTKNKINNFLLENKIDGRIFDIEWVDFSSARNYAIDMAIKYSNCDYGLWIDCDEELIIDKKFNKKYLKSDSYLLNTIYGQSTYLRKNIYKLNKEYRWVGPIHETLYSNVEKTTDIINGLSILVRPDGNSWKEGVEKKYSNHAEILSQYSNINTDPRWIFYTAQSYRDSNQIEKAIEWYKKRFNNTNGWIEERWYSLYMIAKLMSNSNNYTIKEVYIAYNKAFEFDIQRFEPILDLCKYLIKNNLHQKAQIYGKILWNAKLPTNKTLHINKNLYEFDGKFMCCILLASISDFKTCLERLNILKVIYKGERLNKIESLLNAIQTKTF